MKTKNEIEFEITHYNELINDYKSMGVLYKKQVVKFQRKLNKVKKELANLNREEELRELNKKILAQINA